MGAILQGWLIRPLGPLSAHTHRRDIDFFDTQPASQHCSLNLDQKQVSSSCTTASSSPSSFRYMGGFPGFLLALRLVLCLPAPAGPELSAEPLTCWQMLAQNTAFICSAGTTLVPKRVDTASADGGEPGDSSADVTCDDDKSKHVARHGCEAAAATTK